MSDRALELATLGGGCFWCLEPVFAELEGVERVVCGYAGGTTPNPTYEQVCAGITGHAEVVQVAFDSGRISYAKLLEVFFSIHDPTTRDRQGPDMGTQYRSAIYFHSPAQQNSADRMISKLDDMRAWNSPIVTEVSPLEVFYPAEEIHQEYYDRNPRAPYCVLTIAPKVAKVRESFAADLKRS